jgi:hypothetical protein
LLDPDPVHIAGMTRTQTIRVIGFALILIGGALFVTARRRQKRHRRAHREHEWRREYERRAQPGPSGHEENGPRRRYNWPGQHDWQRRYELPELIHRPEEPHFRDRIRRP